MPKDRTLIIWGVIFLVLLALAILAGKLLSGRNAQAPQGVMPVILYTPQAEVLPTQTAIVVANDPNDFSGDWYFTGFVGKMPSGLLKGNDVGKFVSVDNPNDVMWAVCSAPHSPAPKEPDSATGFPGDRFWWDPNTNHMVDYEPTVKEGTVQIFWYPSRTNPLGQ